MVSAPDFLTKDTVQNLRVIYGSRAAEVMDLAESDTRLREPPKARHPYIAAQEIRSIRREQCIYATDFLLRRTSMGFSPDRRIIALPAVIDRIADELNWSTAKKEDELDAYLGWIRHTMRTLDASKPFSAAGK